MSSFKHLLLLFSIGMLLLAGLLFTSTTSGSRTAFASGCNSLAQGSWSNNCQTSMGNISNFVVAIQTVITFSNTGCTTQGIDGHFGSHTFSGVECFQNAEHIHVDGLVGPITWGKLQSTLICTQTNQIIDCHLPRNSTLLFREELSNSGIWLVSFNGSFCQMVDNSLC